MKQVFRTTPEFLQDIKDLAGVTISPDHILALDAPVPSDCKLARMVISLVHD